MTDPEIADTDEGDPDVAVEAELDETLDDDLDADDDLDEVPAPDDDLVILGGDASLDAAQTNEIAADAGATVVLVAGNQESGKTSLLVALYDQFLFGDFAGQSFVESLTLDAFDRRHFGSRVESGNDRPDTDRTEEREIRFLHLRLADPDGKQRVLLPTDVWGEVFEELANGVDVAANIPIASRIDKTLILIDGESIAQPDMRQTTEKQATLLIGALLEERGVEHSAPMMIALSKADTVNGEAADWYAECARRLQAVAGSRGATTVDLTTVKAAPRDGTDPSGLAEILKWMLTDVECPAAVGPTRFEPSHRVFLSATSVSR